MKLLVVFVKHHVYVQSWKIKIISGVSKSEILGKAHEMAEAWKGRDIPKVDFRLISKKEVVNKLFSEDGE